MSDKRDSTARCWDTLNVSGYLQNWWDSNQETCNRDYHDQGFANCYRQLVGKQKSLGKQCNEIYPEGCGSPPNFDDYAPVEYYVLQSIYGIWGWYNSIWDSVQDGTVRSNAKIGDIVNYINPVKPGDTSLGQILSALTAGFAFVGLPAQLESVVATQAITQAATALQQAPGLGKALLPTGSLDSEFKQLTEIQDSLGDVLTQFQINVANTLKLSQDDFSMFSRLSQRGAFIAKQPSQNTSTTKLTKVLNTFVVSQALQANNIIITVAAGTNPYEVSRNLSSSDNPIAQQNAWHVNCQDNFTSIPCICSNWWYDGKDAYSLFNLGDRNKNYYDLMNYMLEQKWTTGEDLFWGARQCAYDSEIIRDGHQSLIHSFQRLSGGVHWNGQLYIDPQTLTASCGSNVRVCQWNQSHDSRLKDARELNSLENPKRTVNPFYIPRSGSLHRVTSLEFVGDGTTVIESTDPCQLAFPWYCGWFISSLREVYDLNPNHTNPISSLETDPSFLQFKDPNISEELFKQCDTPTMDRNYGWGGAGYIGFRGLNPCDEYPASYIGDSLWTYANFCPKPENGW